VMIVGAGLRVCPRVATQGRPDRHLVRSLEAEGKEQQP